VARVAGSGPPPRAPRKTGIRSYALSDGSPRCAVGSWGGRCPSLAPHVTVMGATHGADRAAGGCQRCAQRVTRWGDAL